MNTIGTYILSVTAASILLSILLSLVDKKGTTHALLRLIGGLFLTFTIISPIANVDFNDLFEATWSFADHGNDIAAFGHEASQSELHSRIKQQCEAYILDKAASYQAQLEVDVVLSSDSIPTPHDVYLKGNISPSAKNALQQWIHDNIGIPKERQIWVE